mgnify:CR=1 FL=1
MMCVVDTSGSMCGSEAAAPLNVAIALGMYCAERLNGPFKDHFISFSRRAHYIEIEGIVIDYEDVGDLMTVAMYAAWLYEKRKDDSSSMPPMIRITLNNRLFSQKVSEDA